MSRPVDEVVASLRSAFLGGRTRALDWRLAQLDALDRLLSREAPAILDALVADLGRSRTEAFLTDVNGVQREVRFLRRHLRSWVRPERVRVPLVLQPARSVVTREPLGVVAVIGPWNYPVNLVLVPLAAALSAGNCCVVKPSEQAPASSALVARLLAEYLDPEAVAVCEGDAAVATAVVDAGVDHVFFTGSPGVGRLVAARAAGRLTPVTLELGGKSPAVVDATADLALAASRIAWGKLLNAGQSCIAPDYVLVEASRADALGEALVAAVGHLVGGEARTHPDFGRIVSERHVDRLAGLLEGHGGRVLLGGEIVRAERYVAPTLVLDPVASSPLLSEEIFGPILPVVPVSGLEEAAQRLAGAPVPLALYLFSEDEAAGRAFLSSTRSGGACWNTTMHHFASSRLPFGGVGESGTGAYHGRYGFERLSQLRPVLRRARRPELRFAEPPYGRAKARLLTGALALPGRLRAAGRSRRPRVPAEPSRPG